jgi:hypothetical protein
MRNHEQKKSEKIKQEDEAKMHKQKCNYPPITNEQKGA